jgi:hypothetical protein
MNASRRRVFYYHANASPIGGTFTRPAVHTAHSHGSSSLAQAGGHASARVSNYRIDGLISANEVYSEIYGSENAATGSWTTVVTAVVEGLNIFETVTADRVVAVLTVDHPFEGAHPRVSVVGSQFENLRIDGVTVTPLVNTTLVKPLATGGAFPANALIEDQDLLARADRQGKKLLTATSSLDWLKERYGWIQSKADRERKGYALCSLVDEVPGAKPGRSLGHVVEVPDFGNVFLGELLSDHHTFRLTMIRVEMGCPVHGTISIGGGDSNGSTMP